MEWIIKGNSIKSDFNIETNEKCQDAIHSIRNKGVISMALADGIGYSLYSNLGAEIAVKTACSYVDRHFDELFEYSKEKISYQVLCAVVRELRKISILENYDFKSLASTLSMVSIKNNKYISVFLGDGTIGKIENDKISLISYFDSTKSKKHKYLTTTSECYHRSYVTKGYCTDIDLFFILSDGILDCFYEIDQDKMYMNLSKIIKKEYENIGDKINKVLTKNKLVDDCSYIIAYKTKDI